MLMSIYSVFVLFLLYNYIQLHHDVSYKNKKKKTPSLCQHCFYTIVSDSGGSQMSRCQIELILALARIFVYRRRHTATISLPDFLNFCKEYRSSERFFFAKRGISERFNQRWRNVEFLF